jgi:hypothetical protein
MTWPNVLKKCLFNARPKRIYMPDKYIRACRYDIHKRDRITAFLKLFIWSNLFPCFLDTT